ncbi:uncharacterized protein BDZ99DRAFT_486874 [Mytilinidion resinicola]|uniref:DUF7726 domain-containing protein n=1 Tax=Mytilinidion resinicola TaxID=574789 RepID=A0A6A6YU06_9PEZI|nr:uncharacterized protein BDZ99DRAFT_486874 [Mytilinidion resinicola]KAF2812261.1 hypothetical protein BDZ99DRAFT_486874 [Mytilinidion resinicola]
MKIGEFCNAIGVSNKSYNGFMSQSGTHKGSGSAAYNAAWKFFKKRELKGIPPPKKKRTTARATTVAAATASHDVASVTVPGEETDSVEIYDTCDEIRRKINLHLKKDGVTQAGFLRDLMAQYHTSDRKIQSKQLTDFRSKKGADRGNTSCVYYASYVFFEKLRIREGKKKTPTREKMEQIWGEAGGMNTTDRGTAYVIVGSGMVPREDRFGRIWSEMK